MPWSIRSKEMKPEMKLKLSLIENENVDRKKSSIIIPRSTDA